MDVILQSRIAQSKTTIVRTKQEITIQDFLDYLKGTKFIL